MKLTLPPTLQERIAQFEHDAQVIGGSFAEEGVSIIEALKEERCEYAIAVGSEYSKLQARERELVEALRNAAEGVHFNENHVSPVLDECPVEYCVKWVDLLARYGKEQG